jgi:hypothetical protein
MIHYQANLTNMKILAISNDKEDIDWTKESDTLEKEALQVYQLYLDGYLREIYFNEDYNAILILECENIAKAYDLLNSLPLVTKGLIGFQAMSLQPYTGYDRIFNKTEKNEIMF